VHITHENDREQGRDEEHNMPDQILLSLCAWGCGTRQAMVSRAAPRVIIVNPTTRCS
jgi:hypothetical protein